MAKPTTEIKLTWVQSYSTYTARPLAGLEMVVYYERGGFYAKIGGWIVQNAKTKERILYTSAENGELACEAWLRRAIAKLALTLGDGTAPEPEAAQEDGK